MRLLVIISFLFSSILYSQEEKRLALVIGNSAYEKGALKNPVNDARLIASTLDSLDFDVILKEDIETQNDFKLAILEFGKKRPNYDVAFVYYAGHGVQISNENYLLPTRQDFTSEDEVELFGVSVQDIMKYLRSQTDQVNILILDACRDNPFESNWNTTRSLKGGGLAKIPPPTGSLIAFSTDSGQTAPDGEGLNSVYTLSLSRNMMLEQTSIDQVFRNVRTDVLKETNGMQRPVEATQLTGKEFYLNPSEYSEIFKKVDDILVDEKEDEIYQGLTMIESVINKTKDKIDKNEALILKARLYGALDEFNNAEEIFNNLIKTDSLYSELYLQYGRLKGDMGEYQKAIELYSKAINLDPGNTYNYILRSKAFYKLRNFKKAEEDIFKTIDLEPENSTNLGELGLFYLDQEKYDEASTFTSKAIEFDSINTKYLNQMGNIYFELNEFDKAKQYYLKILDIDSLYNPAYFNLGLLFEKLNKYQKSIEYYTKAIKLDPNDPDLYYYRTTPYESLKMFDKAEADYLKAIELDPNDIDYSLNLGDLYKNEFNDPEKAKKEYLKAIAAYDKRLEENKNNPEYYIEIANIYSKYLQDFESGLKWIQKAGKLEKTSWILESEALIYFNLGDFKNAEKKYLKALELDPEERNIYYSIANLYIEQKRYKKAKELIIKATSSDINDPDNYYKLAIIFIEEGDYINAYEQLSLSIFKMINNTEDYYISDFDNISKVELKDLYVLRSKIAFKLMGKNNKSCEDLNKALELNNDNISIKEKINEICN